MDANKMHTHLLVLMLLLVGSFGETTMETNRISNPDKILVPFAASKAAQDPALLVSSATTTKSEKGETMAPTASPISTESTRSVDKNDSSEGSETDDDSNGNNPDKKLSHHMFAKMLRQLTSSSRSPLIPAPDNTPEKDDETTNVTPPQQVDAKVNKKREAEDSVDVMAVTNQQLPIPHQWHSKQTNLTRKPKILNESVAAVPEIIEGPKCPTLDQFINGSANLWNGLKEAHGIQAGLNTLFSAVTNAVVVLAQCSGKLLDELGSLLFENGNGTNVGILAQSKSRVISTEGKISTSRPKGRMKHKNISKPLKLKPVFTFNKQFRGESTYKPTTTTTTETPTTTTTEATTSTSTNPPTTQQVSRLVEKESTAEEGNPFAMISQVISEILKTLPKKTNYLQERTKPRNKTSKINPTVITVQERSKVNKKDNVSDDYQLDEDYPTDVIIKKRHGDGRKGQLSHALKKKQSEKT